MSFNSRKNVALAAFIILTAGTLCVSAQTAGNARRLTVEPDSTSVTRKTSLEKKYVSPKEPTDLTTRTEERAGANPPSEVSMSARVHSNTAVAAKPDESWGDTLRHPSTSPPPAATGTWQFQLTPYLWIPTITGRAGIGNLVTDTTTSIGDSDVELNFGFMGTFEARKDKLIILTDLQYSDIATEKGNPGPLYSSSRASFRTFVLDPEIGYRVLDNGKGATLDILGGLRYWHLNADLAFRAGILPAISASRSRSWVDGVAGLRGRAALSQRWFITGKADLGGGGSKFTYQLFGGVGVNVSKRVALVGGYRDLNVNYDKDGFLFDMSLHGPIIGIGMKF
jgi:hypothetical protein